MTDANSRSWRREGANEDLRIEDFRVDDEGIAGGAAPFEATIVVNFVLILAEMGNKALNTEGGG